MNRAAACRWIACSLVLATAACFTPDDFQRDGRGGGAGVTGGGATGGGIGASSGVGANGGTGTGGFGTGNAGGDADCLPACLPTNPVCCADNTCCPQGAPTCCGAGDCCFESEVCCGGIGAARWCCPGGYTCGAQFKTCVG